MTKPTTQQAQDAVKLLLEYIGEDTSREGLSDTPARVIRSYDTLFSGYQQNIASILDKKFFDINEYDDVVLLKAIGFTSMCEHHMLPFYGTVDIAYIPDKMVIGVSKLARLVDIFAKRLQIQERMTADIACAIQQHLKPQGTAVRVTASHSCMTMRGVSKTGSILDTTHFTGVYKHQISYRQEFWHMIKS